MIEQALLAGIFVLATAVAKYRGYKGPILGAAAVLAYFAGIVIGPILISSFTGKLLEPSDQEPLVWNVLVDEYYRIALICGLITSLLIVVLTLLLPRPAAYSGRRPTTRIPYRLIGVLIGAGGVAILFYTNGRFIGALWGFAMIGVAKYCFKLSDRQWVPSGEVALSTAIRPPVLFLRSFSTDDLIAGTSWDNRGWTQNLIFHPDYWKTELSRPLTIEEFLRPDVETLLGPFIALGNPDDYLPAPGAAKIYRGHDNWRETFATLAVKARAVVIVEGTTEGLTWELLYLRNSVPPERIFIITQPLRKRKSDIWEETCRVAEKAEMILPESDPGAGTVLAFDQVWRASPIVTGARSGIEYVSAIKQQLNAANRTEYAKSRREQTAD